MCEFVQGQGGRARIIIGHRRVCLSRCGSGRCFPIHRVYSHFPTPRVSCTSWSSTIRSLLLFTPLASHCVHTSPHLGWPVHRGPQQSAQPVCLPGRCTLRRGAAAAHVPRAQVGVGVFTLQPRIGWGRRTCNSVHPPGCPFLPLCYLLPPCMRLDTLCLPPLSACAIPACLPACPTPQPPAPPSLPPPFLCRWAPGTSFLPACPTLKPPAPSLPSSAGGLPARPTSLRATTTPASTCWRCPPSHKMQCLYRHTAGAVQGCLYWRTAGAVHRVHQRDDARVPRGGQNSCSSLCVSLFRVIELPSMWQGRSGPPLSASSVALALKWALMVDCLNMGLDGRLFLAILLPGFKSPESILNKSPITTHNTIPVLMIMKSPLSSVARDRWGRQAFRTAA